jgi:hypothetical protein
MVVRENAMNHSPYLLFHQTPEQLRRIGARGGKAQARNRRERQHPQPPTAPPTVAPQSRLQPTAAQAIAKLDAQFPWLRGAEKRYTRFQPER